MKFIGRRRELESLETAYQTDGGFVVIYGRRRVGKTTLIKEFIKDKLAFLLSRNRGSRIPEHEAACQCCRTDHEKSYAAESRIF